MPGKTDKPTQNSALQGISEQENFMIKVLFICHGNICRSVSAQYILQDMVNRENRADRFAIDSAAATREEIGNPIYPPMAAEFRKRGAPIGTHRARQLTRADYDRWDLIIGMDDENRADMMQILGGDPEGKIHLLPEYTEHPEHRIEDPWWTGRYGVVFDEIAEGCGGLLESLQKTGTCGKT